MAERDRRLLIAVRSSPCRRIVLRITVTQPTSAMTVGRYLPNAIPRSDEAKCVGGGCIAKNIGVMNRIDSDQAARDHSPTLAPPVGAITRSRRSGAEDAQGGGDCECYESFLSIHGGLLQI
jgi:hypothetical protein